MPIGDPEDFRMSGFMQVLRFGPQDVIGGEGSAALFHSTKPYGSTNGQFPVPPLTFPGLQNPTFTLPGITLPPTLPPVLIQPTGTGGAGATTITVEDLATPAGPFTGIDTLQFDGTGVAVTNPPSTPNVALVTITAGGGGGGSTTLEYGQVTAVAKGTYAEWTYTVQRYLAGAVNGAPVTAYNLLEYDNDATTAYGYTIVGSGGYDQISGTSYYIRSVPVGTWVRMEYTDAIDGTFTYWFSAPNRIDGGC